MSNEDKLIMVVFATLFHAAALARDRHALPCESYDKAKEFLHCTIEEEGIDIKELRP